MAQETAIFTGSFPNGEGDEFSDTGRRPVIFDVLGPDQETSILPVGYRLVLHVNPSTMSIKYTRKIARIQTRGGFVEQHWGDDAGSLNFEMATGGFMRLYTGLSAITSPTETGGTRRETLAYDSYLDMLALFHSNASVYDINGQVAFQGIIKVSFDGGSYLGYFTSFTVTESADTPYQLKMTAGFDIKQEIQVWRTAVQMSSPGASVPTSNPTEPPETSSPTPDPTTQEASPASAVSTATSKERATHKEEWTR